MKKKTAIILCSIMVLSLAGCGNSSGSAENQQESSVQADNMEDVNTEDTVNEVKTEETEQDNNDGETQSGNMIKNGDFSAGTENWGLFLMGGQAEMAVDDEGALKVDVDALGDVAHGVQLYYDGFSLYKGCKYNFSFDIYSTTPCMAEWRIQINGGDYHAYAGEKVSLTEEKQTINCEFTMEDDSDVAPRLCINMGNIEENPADLDKHSIYFDNFSLIVTDESNKAEEAAAADIPDIKINQIGYRPSDKKIAVFTNTAEGSAFTVIDAKTNEEVFSGMVTSEKDNPNAGETNTYGDFSEVTNAGTYKVKNSDGKESYEFRVGEDVYDELMKDTLKMFYLQRCGTELNEEYAGKFAHEVCHNSEAVVFGTDKKVDVSGGWHDAGDYGRYVVSGAKAVMDLMLAYETNPDIFGDDLGIPESGNNVPDILDECRYELEWLLKMQDNESGGVYHKVTCANFPETVMPEKETAELILSPISTTATGDFAAVLAKASLVYKDIDAEFAGKCLKASEKAYDYLDKTSGGKGFKNPASIATGEYPDEQDADERFFAACELYNATGDAKYKNYIESSKLNTLPKGLGWADVATYAFNDYLNMDSEGTLSGEVKDMMKEQTDSFVKQADADGYECTLGDSYSWGSNMTAANNAIVLAMAQNHGIGNYSELVKKQLDYLLGRNATSYCFVTGYGTLSPEHPHHRPSQFVGEAMKGLVIGGPNSGLDDPYAKAALAEMPPAKCYTDSEQSYSCNEITIYWNSPVVYLLAEIMK